MSAAQLPERAGMDLRSMKWIKFVTSYIFCLFVIFSFFGIFSNEINWLRYLIRIKIKHELLNGGIVFVCVFVA